MAAVIYASDKTINDPSNLLPPFNAIDSTMNSGTVALLDPSHSSNPISAAPTNGGNLPNIVPTSQLNTLLSQTNVDSDYTFPVTLTGLGAGAVQELTPKKALNVTITQTSQAAAIKAEYNLANKIKQYILDRSAAGDTFLFVLQKNITRAAVTSGLGTNVTPPDFVFQNSSSPTSNLLASQLAAGVYPSSGSKFVGSYATPGINNTGECFFALAVNGWTGTAPILAAFMAATGFGAIGGSTYASASWYNKFGSGALRRFAIENLTVSGRTFTQAVVGTGKKDSYLEQWQRDLAAGGRWAGDTLRDPTTVP